MTLFADGKKVEKVIEINQQGSKSELDSITN